MNSNPDNSGHGPQYTEYMDDPTNPSTKKDEMISSYLLTKLDSNIDVIKDDLKEIKIKSDFDYKMLISDISVGVISSFIVSILILFITTNLGQQNIVLLGLQLPVFFLFSISLILVSVAVYFITIKIHLRKNKKKRKKY